MSQISRKALVISPWWAGIFSAVFISSIIGFITYAWNANASFAVLQQDVSEIKKAELPIRLARMEEQLNNQSESFGRLEKSFDKVNDKLDRALNKQ